MGFQGQTGSYTDIETQHKAAGLYTALSGPIGVYYDPQSGAGMARSSADALNTYDQLLHPFDGWTFGAYAKTAREFGVGELKGGVNYIADMATLGLISHPLAAHGQNEEAGAETLPVIADGVQMLDGVGELRLSARALEGGAARVAAGTQGKGAASFIARIFKKHNCFVAGTRVQMADGTTRPIEQVQAGDLVKSRNAQTGKLEAKRVDRTYVRVAPQVVALTFTDSATHQTEAFTCTPEHPFLVDGKGYVQAGQLGIGTSIVTRAGPALTLSASSWGAAPAFGGGLLLDGQVHAASVTVYNLRVEDDHAYFVGTIHGGICVHNADYEIFERFGSEAEAVQAQEAQKLTQRPGHPNGEKWISDVGEIKRPQGLGQDVTHRMEIKASPGTREWLRQFEIKTNEPNRYAVPAGKLGEFNARVNSISTKRFRLMGRQMRRR